MRRTRSILSLFIALISVAGCTQSPHTADTLPPEPPNPLQRAAIQQALLQATAEGSTDPTPVSLEQIALDSEYALATWTRGEQGGQALLRWEDGSWKVLVHEAGWLGLRRLTRLGVPGQVSKSLLDQIDPNWPSYEDRF
ncbi:MAG TPA: hypothetical protein VN493_15450 [Thermoanaerobaculia bacterium]|nr:hypothetical protein [Thermoanaerobaculia bacterium]